MSAVMARSRRGSVARRWWCASESAAGWDDFASDWGTLMSGYYDRLEGQLVEATERAPRHRLLVRWRMPRLRTEWLAVTVSLAVCVIVALVFIGVGDRHRSNAGLHVSGAGLAVIRTTRRATCHRSPARWSAIPRSKHQAELDLRAARSSSMLRLLPEMCFRFASPASSRPQGRVSTRCGSYLR